MNPVFDVMGWGFMTPKIPLREYCDLSGMHWAGKFNLEVNNPIFYNNSPYVKGQVSTYFRVLLFGKGSDLIG